MQFFKLYLIVWAIIYAVMIKKALNKSNIRCLGLFHDDTQLPKNGPGSILGGYEEYKCRKCSKIRTEWWSMYF